MDKKNRLLSIGEISRFTGASIKSLRYYEKIGILEPTFVDPYSGYRYYSFDQIYLINIILFCIELDIPLKELTKYIDKDQTIDLSALLAYGKGIAEEKLNVLRRGMRYIGEVEGKIALAEKHQQGRIYSREIPEKIFYVIPREHSFEKDTDMYETLKPFGEFEYSEDDYYGLLEYGYMCEHSPSGIRRYYYMELTRPAAKVNVKRIPAGTYFCRQSGESQIEHSPEIFKEYLAGSDSFLTIETETIAGTYKVNKPINELRVIAFSA
ncbi:MAG: MerR family transcriptional regulator [Treponema sp.]|nr:MerR family transcriptional regulator [Treponema sp.]